MSQMQPMADSRGRDWGLPSSGRGRVGITRPISVVLTANHLDLLPEDRNQSRQRIEFNESLQNSVEDLVTRLWSRMDEWGIAGPGMHWKPVLNVRVDPSGEQRYQELVRLLEDSGIVVKRKN